MSGQLVPLLVIILVLLGAINTGDVASAQQKLDNIQTVNGGCAIDEIPYNIDGDATQPACGKCIPGTSGAEDTSQMCDLNEYCSDNATCIHVRNHPLYGRACPYELGGNTAEGFCGPGLRCYLKKCLPCQEGSIDYSDGKRCVDNLWTKNQWDGILTEPTPMLIIVLIGLVTTVTLLTSFVELCCCIGNRIRERVKLKKKQDEMEQIQDEEEEQIEEDLSEASHEEDEEEEIEEPPPMKKTFKPEPRRVTLPEPPQKPTFRETPSRRDMKQPLPTPKVMTLPNRPPPKFTKSPLAEEDDYEFTEDDLSTDDV
jgi:uncharacterized membrane protein YuzA (DUF378 family)